MPTKVMLGTIKLGTKWKCALCGARFYDLGRPKPLCPSCGADQTAAPEAEAEVGTKPGKDVSPEEPEIVAVDEDEDEDQDEDEDEDQDGDEDEDQDEDEDEVSEIDDDELEEEDDDFDGSDEEDDDDLDDDLDDL